MKKIDVGQTISILANIGVIAGIVFLGLELRQNNELMMADARRSRSESSEVAFRVVADSAELAAIFVKAGEGQELSAVEAFRFRAYWMAVLINLQSTYQDLRPEELDSIFNRYRSYRRSYPMLIDIWSANRMNLQPLFVELMDANVFLDEE